MYDKVCKIKHLRRNAFPMTKYADFFIWKKSTTFALEKQLGL